MNTPGISGYLLHTVHLVIDDNSDVTDQVMVHLVPYSFSIREDLREVSCAQHVPQGGGGQEAGGAVVIIIVTHSAQRVRYLGERASIILFYLAHIYKISFVVKKTSSISSAFMGGGGRNTDVPLEYAPPQWNVKMINVC